MSLHEEQQDINVQDAPPNLDQLHGEGGEAPYNGDDAPAPNNGNGEGANNGQQAENGENGEDGGANADADGPQEAADQQAQGNPPEAPLEAGIAQEQPQGNPPGPPQGNGPQEADAGGQDRQEEQDAGEQQRRRNLGDSRPMHLRERVDFSVGSLALVPSTFSIMRSRTPYNRTTYSLISLSRIEGGAPTIRTVMPVILLDITPTTSSSRDGRIGHRQQQNVRPTHDKRILLMDPFGEEGNNVICLFHGSVSCTRFFDAGPDLRDNGALRE